MAVLLTAVPAASAATPPWDPFFAAPATAVDVGATTRPYGVASGDFDEDGDVDLVVGRATGHLVFAAGNGDGTFAAPVALPGKQTTNNAWSLAAGDIDSDGNLDVVWGANTDSSGCFPTSPCTTPTLQVRDGEVRAFLGNGNGTFQETAYFVSGVRHNKGVLLADVGTDAGSLDVADVDADGDQDVVVGSLDGTNSAVKVLRNAGSGAFTAEPVVSQATTASSPIYFPAIQPTTSPWGLAFGDADADGDTDLFVGDRALYVYLFRNDGTGAFTLVPGNIPEIAGSRPNVYLRHDPTYRAAVGFTPSLAAGDLDGDGRADVAVGLHSGTQAANTTAHDGEIVLSLSGGGRHKLFGVIGDVGSNARGLQIEDANGDGVRDVLAGALEGKVSLLRQLEPVDADGDGISDYVDNAPEQANAPRLDMDTDGAITFRDQLDNDGDTVLGDPEDRSTWQRLGDPADGDDDNDGRDDGDDVCRLVADPGQGDRDEDGRGDACDPLDDTDSDSDGVPDGPMPGDPLYAESRAAAAKWSTGDTHFVIRIDALGRFFQNEFTGLMTDAATSTPDTWAARCQGMYDAGDPDPGCAGLPGGKELPISLVVIPRLLWTDPEVVAWINDRNDDPRFELGQHGTYHASNTTLGDWKDLADRNFFSCELCGFDATESFELLKAGRDTLTGDYANPHLRASGATDASPKVDWSTSANPLISYAPPFNASDTESRRGLSMLGFRSFSASVHEEDPNSLGQFFSPEGSHHERFDQFGMFHASADTELEPPETVNGAYDPAAYEEYLRSETNDGGLTTWLIEEVEWSGRPCNELDRLDDLCNGGSNREDNTVYRPRWDGWMQLLDYVRSYPGGVAMTLGEVALAKGYDNAPTAANPSQADADSDGVGDAIDGAALEAAAATLVRGQAGGLSAVLRNGAGEPIAGQRVVFSFDADGDGTEETQAATTDGDGEATVQVTASRGVGAAGYGVSWDGLRGVTAADTGTVAVRDTTTVTLDPANPGSGQVTDTVTVAATLTDSDGAGVEGMTIAFSIGAARVTTSTDASGYATVTLVLPGPAGAETLEASFAGAGDYAGSTAQTPFTVQREDTVLTLSQTATRSSRTITARLVEADGGVLGGQAIQFLAEVRRGKEPSFMPIASATTGSDGRAVFDVPAQYRNARIRAQYEGDSSYLPSSREVAGD